MADTKTHLQVHNVWPITYATLISVAGLIFTLGSLHTRFEILEKNFEEYKVETNKKLDNLYMQTSSLRSYDRQEMIVLDKNGRVQGIATSSATLSITPPVIQTVTPTKMPAKPTEGEQP